jgi:hypothetical protein
MKRVLPVFCLLALLACACSSARDLYKGPGGVGRYRFDPERGIEREGANLNVDEQTLYRTAQRFCAEKNWGACIQACENLTRLYPDGQRAVDAILLRCTARIEGNRSEDEGPSDVVPLANWFTLYLAPVYDDRIRELLAKGGETAKLVRELRERSFESFIELMRPEGESMSAEFKAIGEDIALLIDYYLPVYEVDVYRRRVAELGRDVAWLAFAARNYETAKDIARVLEVLNPPPGVKGDVLFIRGHALMRSGAHSFAADTFGQLFFTAKLRDVDTPWRPYALYWLIVETMAKSKGPEYEIQYYEVALELLEEYRNYLVENPNLSRPLRERFRQLTIDIHNVFIFRAEDAADTYARVNQGEGEAEYLKLADEWREKLKKRLESEPTGP